jgi:MFS family permease
MQQVLFSWLVVGELRANPSAVGAAQTASMLPALLLLLVGGATAERVDTRRLLVWLHALAALPVLALCATVASGRLSLTYLVLYAVAIGSVQAFALPARDALLSRVAGSDLMRAITGMTAVQFAAQGLGAFSAGGARLAGSAPMLALQAAVLAAGAVATFRLPAAPPLPQSDARRSPLRELTGGLPIVARTPELRWPLVLAAAVGVLFIGPYLVVFPLLVRDVYGGDAFELALVTVGPPLGTIAGSLFIRARGGIRRKGAGMLCALAYNASNLALIGLGLPFWGMLVVTLVWGLGSAVFINCSRTVFQQAAPPAARARVLSIYQLGFLGAAPLGTTLAGLASASLGLHGTLLLSAGVMYLVVGGVALFTRTASME